MLTDGACHVAGASEGRVTCGGLAASTWGQALPLSSLR